MSLTNSSRLVRFEQSAHLGPGEEREREQIRRAPVPVLDKSQTKSFFFQKSSVYQDTNSQRRLIGALPPVICTSNRPNQVSNQSELLI